MRNSILYHGAVSVVTEPLTNVGRSELDFGPGFYLTNERQQAIRWAQTKASRKPQAKAILNTYKFDEDGFRAENAYTSKIFLAYNKGWLDFIAQSRRGMQPWLGIDWIEGGIANDSVISTVDAYVDDLITAEQAMDRLVNEELRHQVCISNQEIIDKYLIFSESFEV